MKNVLRYTLYIIVALIPSFTFAQNDIQDLCLNTVVIDPGHGGKDPGTISADKKTQEKTLTLAVSKLLAKKIQEEYPSMKVALTRETDVFVPLDERARKATRLNANLFISIHINAVAKNTSPNGFSAYILGQSSNKSEDTYAFNMEVVARENSVIYLEDDYGTKYAEDDSPEAQILMKFMYTAFREQSLLFAEQVNEEMKSGPLRKSIGVHQANLCVLRLASMPAVLLELGYMTNPEDLKILRSNENINRMADNIFKAFCKFKSEYDHSVTSEEISLDGKDDVHNAEAGTGNGQSAEAAAGPDSGKASIHEGNESAVRYGYQVLASSKKMSPNDKFFKGYVMTSVQVGTIYKYIVSPVSTIEEMKSNSRNVKKDFPDAFPVKIENGATVRLKL